MIRKSGYRFSEKDHAQIKEIEPDDDSKKSHLALARIALIERDPTDPLRARHRLFDRR